MSKPRKSLKFPRSLAFSRQHGNCYYCRQPMWTNDPQQFSSKHCISLSQAKRFQCTGEHLISHADGGSSAQHNIVAACWFCNIQRHRRENIPNPNQYKKLVQKRMNKGGWHNVKLSS